MSALIVVTGTEEYPVAHVEGATTVKAVIDDLPWIIGSEPAAIPVGKIKTRAKIDDRREMT